MTQETATPGAWWGQDRRGPWLAVMLAVVSLLCACNGIDEMRWREEVWLHDKSFIYVDRYAARASSGFPNSRRGPTLRQALRFETLQVDWKSEGFTEEVVSFDVIDGVPYLVTIPAMSPRKFCQGKARGTYVANYYRWTSGVEQKISMNQAPMAVLLHNLSGGDHWNSRRENDRSYLSWYDVLLASGQSGTPELLADMFKRKSWLRCK